MDGPEITGREQGTGRFAPGQSGNPAGRPRGARNRATQAAEAILSGEAEALTRKAVELALAGDVTALRLCLERFCPLKEGAPWSSTFQRFALRPILSPPLPDSSRLLEQAKSPPMRR